jgi:hypothetical protein
MSRPIKEYIVKKCDYCENDILMKPYRINNINNFCSQKCHDEFEINKHKNEWILKAKKKHNNFYDYSLSNYKGALKELIILCPKHGQFKQLASNHLYGSGCKKCAKEYIGLLKKEKTILNFLQIAPIIHNNFYDYSLVNVNNFDVLSRKIEIICPVHGNFIQRIDSHLLGTKCKKCQTGKSKGENNIEYYLKNNNIKYELHKTFKDCLSSISKYHLYFDFYLPEFNICIEYNGKQHYECTEYFNNYKIDKNIAKQKFEIQQNNDKNKIQFCENNNIKLIIIHYSDFNNIEHILKERLYE